MTTPADESPQAWASLPPRIYLDTSVLQTLFDFGGEIFENEPFEPVGRAARVEGLGDEIDALRMIFKVNQRAMFEFVVTDASLRRSRLGTSIGSPNGSTTSWTPG